MFFKPVVCFVIDYSIYREFMSSRYQRVVLKWARGFSKKVALSRPSSDGVIKTDRVRIRVQAGHGGQGLQRYYIYE